MVKGKKDINGAKFYDENPENLRLKLKFINHFYFYEKSFLFYLFFNENSIKRSKAFLL